MVAYRRGDRPGEGYRVQPTLPGFGRVGPWQTGFTDKRQAQRVEAYLRELALTEPAFIQALQRGEFTLQELWVAKLTGRTDELLAGAKDPLLADAVEAYRPLCKDARTRNGLSQLVDLAPDGARVSWLVGKNINELYGKALAEGRKPNSVYRSLHRAVAELLLHQVGEEGRRRAMQGVKVPSEDDTREVHVTPDELRRVLGAITDERFRWMAALAILTTADRKPLLALEPRHFNEKAGTLRIPDKKTASRARILRLSGPALTIMRLAVAGLEPRERIFPWDPRAVWQMWHDARTAAGVPDLRWKDLRHLLPTTLAALGVDRREIEALLGHAPGSKETRRYITPVGSVPVLDKAAAELGLDALHLRAVGE